MQSENTFPFNWDWHKLYHPLTAIKCKSLPVGVFLPAADGADEDYIQSNRNKPTGGARRFYNF